MPVAVPKTSLLFATVICMCPCGCLAFAHNNTRGREDCKDALTINPDGLLICFDFVVLLMVVKIGCGQKKHLHYLVMGNGKQGSKTGIVICFVIQKHGKYTKLTDRHSF